MAETQLISIVIVNYNVRQLLIDCLHSIYSKTNGSVLFETIVIDNDSKDDSVSTISERFPQVILIENKYNAGFPAANNQGFRAAKGKYIFMLNPDTELIDDALVKLYNFMEQHTEISLIAPKLLNSDKSRQLSVWRFPSLWYLFCETHYLNLFLGKKNYFDKNLDQPFEAESFSGAAIFFRKELFSTIGVLDESMFWIEDTDFCYRAYRAKLKLLYYPKAEVLHHIGQSAKKNYNISISNQIFNKIKFFKKHHSAFEWLLIVLLSFYHVTLKLIVFGLLSPFNLVYFRKAKAYLYTLPRVFNPPQGIK